MSIYVAFLYTFVIKEPSGHLPIRMSKKARFPLFSHSLGNLMLLQMLLRSVKIVSKAFLKKEPFLKRKEEIKINVYVVCCKIWLEIMWGEWQELNTEK